MARISTYSLDTNPSLDDRVIGSDFDSSNKKSVQFSFGQIQSLMSGVNSGPIIASIYAADGGEADETNAGFFTSLLVDGVISTTTEIKINKTSSQSQDLTDFFTIITNYIALPDVFFRFNIKNSGDNTNFGLFEVTNVVDNTTHYTLTLTLETGAASGSFIDETTYVFIPEFGTSSGGGGNIDTITGNLVDNTDPVNPVVNGVESVSGDGVDNTDPANPVVNIPLPVDITWAQLVALAGKKNGDRFNITDRKNATYPLPMGEITLHSSTTFFYKMPSGLTEEIEII